MAIETALTFLTVLYFFDYENVKTKILPIKFIILFSSSFKLKWIVHLKDIEVGFFLLFICFGEEGRGGVSKGNSRSFYNPDILNREFP